MPDFGHFIYFLLMQNILLSKPRYSTYVTIFVMGSIFFCVVDPSHSRFVLLLGSAIALAITYIALSVLNELLKTIHFHIKAKHQMLLMAVLGLLALLRSFGQLSLRDSIMVVIFAIIAGFYISRFRKGKLE